jgi:hypothetical protein
MPASRVAVRVIETDENATIAREAVRTVTEDR